MLKRVGLTLGLGKSSEAMLKAENSLDVFLGGSCNPTTWRHELAIPKFKSWGITYFNPQVAEWHPGLVEVENKAKSNSGVLFFVIDDQTRATSSMVEVANLAGSPKRIVVVIKCFSGPEAEISGETLSLKEFKELCESQQLLHDLMNHQAIPVFSDINKALDYTRYILKESKTYACNKCKFSRHILLRRLEDISESHRLKSSGVTFSQTLELLEKIFHPTFSKSELRDILLVNKTVMPQDNYSYSDLENLINDISTGQKHDKFFDVVISKTVEALRPISQIVGWLTKRSPSKSETFANDNMNDVYLGGSDDFDWRSDVIEVLEKAGFSYNSPQGIANNKHIDEHKYASSELWSVIQNSSVILFVVTKRSRSLCEMVMASYLIGLRTKNVVLCIQTLSEEANTPDDHLSSTALKDYNRCRTYLKDIAAQHNIPLFDHIGTAVNQVLNLLKPDFHRSSKTDIS